jgi:hypothetical protein
VAEAEKLVAEGKANGAMQHVEAYFRAATVKIPKRFGPDSVFDGALVVAAQAVARSQGKLAMPKLWERPTANSLASLEGLEEERNLREAVDLLELDLEAHPDSPISRARLAEAESLLPERRSKAKATLDELERTGLLPSAWGYAALARLRRTSTPDAPAWLSASIEASDALRLPVSTGRCESMAKPKALCLGEPLTVSMQRVELQLYETIRD